MLLRRKTRQPLFRCARQHSVDELEYSSLDWPQHTCGLMDIQCPHCHSLMWLGEKTGGSSAQPKFGICCMSGKVEIPRIPDPPDSLLRMFTSNENIAKHFRKNIRKFNSGMAMASMKTTDATIAGGLASYRIQGVVYRMIGPPRNATNQQPACLQTYFFDLDEQVRLRTLRQPPNPGEAQLDSEVFRALIKILNEAPNAYLNSYITIQEQIDAGNILPNVRVGIHADKRPDGEHARRYNLPTSNEIAILMPESSGEAIPERSRMVVCNFRAQQGVLELQTFNETHRSYDPLQYPCLFPYGTDGWHLGIPHQHGTGKVTALQFYSYRIMKRHDSVNILLLAGRLFQQYCVDQFAKIESSRLRYLQLNQAVLRADLYNGLADAIQSGDADRAGRRYILPSSFTAGPRFMLKHYLDAMAIVRKFGKPTLFVTFTCNPQWPEITSELEPGQSASDRPDITARVFHLKQRQLLDDIRSGVFGNLTAHVNTIEFQKRGLPHCHFILRGEQHTWEDVDRVISAELPNPNNPLTRELFEVVKKHMVHGPCGNLNRQSPCMTDGTCTKNYPKSFRSVTSLGNDSYPDYRRRSTSDGGFSTTVRIRGCDVEVNNSNIVPYNAWLLMKYRAHINVEYCSSIKAVKYLYKYIFKGSDQATVSFQNQEDHVHVSAGTEEKDEIHKYESFRYIGASEACWRLFEFPIQQRNPAVECLPIHLPGENSVTFDPNNPELALQHAACTKLMAYSK